MMNSNIPPLSGISMLRAAALLCALQPFAVSAGPKDVGDPVQPAALETEMDVPTSFHKYFGQRINSWRDSERAIAKVDLDSDINFDGIINNNDPQDGGAFEGTPPGLQVGVGEMSKVILRVLPYRVDFDGEVVVTLELSGINRDNSKGTFESFEEEKANVGHVRVWRDASRKELLLDSANPDKHYAEFATQYRVYPYNLPNEIPRSVYVEGVKASPRHLGDIRLLLTCSHRAPGTAPESFSQSRKKLLKSFRTTFDHILLTVPQQPVKKEFINNNAEANWLKVSSSK